MRKRHHFLCSNKKSKGIPTVIPKMNDSAGVGLGSENSIQRDFVFSKQNIDIVRCLRSLDDYVAPFERMCEEKVISNRIGRLPS